MEFCVVLVSGNIPFEFSFDVRINRNFEQPRESMSQSLCYSYLYYMVVVYECVPSLYCIVGKYFQGSNFLRFSWLIHEAQKLDL